MFVGSTVVSTLGQCTVRRSSETYAPPLYGCVCRSAFGPGSATSGSSSSNGSMPDESAASGSSSSNGSMPDESAASGRHESPENSAAVARDPEVPSVADIKNWSGTSWLCESRYRQCWPLCQVMDATVYECSFLSGHAIYGLYLLRSVTVVSIAELCISLCKWQQAMHFNYAHSLLPQCYDPHRILFRNPKQTSFVLHQI